MIKNKKYLPFSVSMCVYKNDNAEFFKKALESIINQTVVPNEIVIVVDGPISNSIENILKLYENEDYFKIIRLSKNLGHGNARRIGLENCSNDIVALMDADDISRKDRFEKQILCFENNNNLSVVGGFIQEFYGSVSNIVGLRKVPVSDLEIKKYLKKRCPFNQVTVMFKKSEVEKAGGYLDWFNEEDYYLWIRMAQNNFIFFNLEDILVDVRVGKEMYARRGGKKYFFSEAKLQKYMYEHKIINYYTYLSNVSIRFFVQILMPNKIRSLIYAKFARSKEKS